MAKTTTLDTTAIINAAKALAESDNKNTTNTQAEAILLEAGVLMRKDGEILFTPAYLVPKHMISVCVQAFEAYESIAL